MSCRHLVVLIHGIRTKRTSASWPKHFAGWLWQRHDVATEAIYYEAAPLPIWNNLVKNPRLAKDVVSRIETRHLYDASSRIHIVAHSNGGVVAALAMRQLAARGIRTSTAIFTGAAIDSDVESSGLAELVADGWLGRAIAYSSPDDEWVRPWLEWVPGFYGSLGSLGFRRNGGETGLRIRGYQPIGAGAGAEWGASRIRFVTRWFAEFGHGEYFDPAHRESTFGCIARDLGIG